MTTPHLGLLFHFTHVDNLDGILREGALLADNSVRERGLLRNECGHTDIKERRRKRLVSCPPGGVVADYVPFYFAARSPMMYVIAQGRVSSFSGDHRDLVYLVSDVGAALQLDQPSVISDRNAAVGIADFSNDPAVLGDLTTASPNTDFVDWSIMTETYWNDTPEYPDRMERRMAEFLVHREFPVSALKGFATYSDVMSARVEQMLASSGYVLPVAVRPNWYY